MSRTGIFGISKGKVVDEKFGDVLNRFGVSVILIERRNGTYESNVKKWFTKKITTLRLPLISAPQGRYGQVKVGLSCKLENSKMNNFQSLTHLGGIEWLYM